MTSETFDLVVVGGGPCGSTVSTLVAQQGHRVLVLEKERFPRYQIGESLLPSTVHGICKLLGVTEELAAAGFPIKHGGTFRWGANPEPWTFDFSLSQNFAGDSSTGYQVERMKFDVDYMMEHCPVYLKQQAEARAAAEAAPEVEAAAAAVGRKVLADVLS